MIKLFKVKEKQKEIAENAKGKPPVKKQSAGELRLHKGIVPRQLNVICLLSLFTMYLKTTALDEFHKFLECGRVVENLDWNLLFFFFFLHFQSLSCLILLFLLSESIFDRLSSRHIHMAVPTFCNQLTVP